MSFEIIILLGITISMFGLFVWDKIRPDTVALMTACALMLTGIVTPSEGISGFSDTAVITIMCMLIISVAMQHTGLVYFLGKRVFKIVGKNITLQIFAIALMVAPISGFMSSTATVAIMIPLLIGLANQSRVPATKTLIPLSYIAQMGGMLTIIGTTVNILANSIIIDLGHAPLNMFELTPVAILMLIFGVSYLAFIGHRILPDKLGQIEEPQNIFYSQIRVCKDSPLIGKTIKQSGFIFSDLKVAEIIRGGRYILKTKRIKLKEGDILNIKANGYVLLRLLKRSEIEVLTNFDPGSRKFKIDSKKIARITLNSNAHWVGKGFDKINFYDRYHAKILGVDYKKEPDSGNLLSHSLNNGDTLLVAASSRHFAHLIAMEDFILVDEVEPKYHPEKMPLVIGVLIGVVLFAALGILPIVVSALLGVIVLILSGAIKIDEAYHEINWQVIFILAGLIPLGIAFEKTGLMEIASQFMVSAGGGLHPLLLLLLFYVTTTTITEFISNAGTVILLTPLALHFALTLGFDPVPFVGMVMFGASTSFTTPIGYQTNTMVYTAGKYKFTDFIKVGLPLNLLTAFVVSVGAYFFWIV